MIETIHKTILLSLISLIVMSCGSSKKQNTKVLSSDEETWIRAEYHNYLKGYEKYLILHPQGDYRIEAQKRISTIKEEEIKLNEVKSAWDRVRGRNTISAYETFLNEYENSKFSSEIMKTIDEFKDKALWNIAVKKDSPL